MNENKNPALIAALEKTGFMMEFLETLINDASIPGKLRRQVWTMCTTKWERQQVAIDVVVKDFGESTDEVDLTSLWQDIVAQLWPALPDMPLKRDVDKLPDHEFNPE